MKSKRRRIHKNQVMNHLPIHELSRILNSLQMKRSDFLMVAHDDKSFPVSNTFYPPELVQQESASDVSVRMLRLPQVERSLDSEEAMLLAECYGATADAIQLLLDAHESQFKFGLTVKQCATFLAEAQLSIRSVLISLTMPTDEDQYELFTILRTLTARCDFYIEQLEGSLSEVSQAQVSELRRRIETARIPLEDVRNTNINMSELQSLLPSKPMDDEQWLLIARHIATLISKGLKPSNKQLREILLPVFEEIPALDNYPKEFGQVIDAIDSYLATRSEPEQAIIEEVPTQEVLNLRQLLEGRKVVLIGGFERKSPKRKLEEAFGLDELTWISTTSHMSVKRFEPYVRKKDVAVVLLTIRFSSHSFGEVKSDCDKAGVPMVRLLAGYGINQVARQILEQCGNRLTRSPLSV